MSRGLRCTAISFSLILCVDVFCFLFACLPLQLTGLTRSPLQVCLPDLHFATSFMHTFMLIKLHYEPVPLFVFVYGHLCIFIARIRIIFCGPPTFSSACIPCTIELRCRRPWPGRHLPKRLQPSRVVCRIYLVSITQDPDKIRRHKHT